MLSRIFWVVLAGVALVAGAATQGNLLFDWGGDRETEAAVEARVERAVEERLSKMDVVDADGDAIEVRAETKRELGHAVRRLVSAEAELALASVTDGGESALDETRARRDAARADIERLKGEIDREEQLSDRDRERMQREIQQQVRSSVRETVRAAVRN